jgi:putative hydrolase of the HAD superfamily
VPTPKPRAVLLDADGVVQQNPSGWFEDLHGFVPAGQGRTFVDDIFATEKAAMVGERSFHEVLEEVAARWGVAHRLDELLAQWRRVEVSRPVVELVEELRARGIRCCLASNQHAYRARVMDDLGYRDLFDAAFYSCDLGVLKSSEVFFERVLEALGLPAGEVLLVDDSEEYVDTARRCGLQAVQWSLADTTAGLDVLRARLTA